ncbi:MAG: UDP-N-acetylglucosamine 2-epimerase (non-hydrolyzing) [Bacteroidota bacterium]|nr:UDP-N-acetylglucosamine 2-epimerase (non-hydrolyzing) [Bacteroidota bacterium]
MRICTVVGARPQFVKAAAVSPALQSAGIQEVLVHTGQHYDRGLSQVFFDELGVPNPVTNLSVGSASHARQTGQIMERLEAFIQNSTPFDALLLYGDTNSTVAGALVSAKLQIPIAHVEAGLRSFDRTMPEEINRIVTDCLSQWLFAPTQTAVDNLRAEGLRQGTVRVGDVMLDATRMFAKRARKRFPLSSITHHMPRKYALSTVHRPSNTDSPANLQAIFAALGCLPRPVIMPLHPRTRAKMQGIRVPGNVEIIEPISYMTMLVLIENACRLLTDSGGIQKEAYWLKTPCVTLRTDTEWPETCQHGWNSCVGTNPEAIVKAATTDPTGPQFPFGHAPRGTASDLIAEALTGRLGTGVEPHLSESGIAKQGNA